MLQQVSKVCTKCGVRKPQSAFNRRGGSEIGVRARCKACVRPDARKQQYHRRHKDFAAVAKHASYMDAYRTKNKKRILLQATQSHFRRKYGLTIEQRDAMLADQGGKCAICKTLTPKSKKGFVVDHNKNTGRIRAILCAPCNSGIGHLMHDPVVLRAAATYLEVHDVTAN